VATGQVDVVALHLVTMGQAVADYAAELFAKDAYRDYPVADEDPAEAEEFFKLGLLGVRVLAWLPACPNLEDHASTRAVHRRHRRPPSRSQVLQRLAERHETSTDETFTRVSINGWLLLGSSAGRLTCGSCLPGSPSPQSREVTSSCSGAGAGRQVTSDHRVPGPQRCALGVLPGGSPVGSGGARLVHRGHRALESCRC
jgi:hypothetical protein